MSRAHSLLRINGNEDVTGFDLRDRGLYNFVDQCFEFRRNSGWLM